jgi:hypothetical protein
MQHVVGLLPTDKVLSVLQHEYQFVYIDPSARDVILVSTCECALRGVPHVRVLYY